MKTTLLGVTLALLTLTTTPSVTATDTAAAKSDTEEYRKALQLTPDLENGRRLFVNCVSCHGPEGWGDPNGAYPQIAGQLAGVIIKQLEDIRAGNRSNPLMRAFTSSRVLGGAQEIADVAAYVASLPMTPYNGQGRQELIPQGQAIYEKHCSDCHGKQAEGDSKDLIPLLQGQHYRYLQRQFDHIRRGLRRNADEKMVKQIKAFRDWEEDAVLSYTASLRPPEEKLAPPGWINPDFPYYPRPPLPLLR